MERMTGEAQNAYTVAVAATEKFCEQNNVIMKITESFPFVVHFTIDAPLTLLEANSGELIAPQIIVTVGIDSTVKSRADKAVETTLLKKTDKECGRACESVLLPDGGKRVRGRDGHDVADDGSAARQAGRRDSESA